MATFTTSQGAVAVKNYTTSEDSSGGQEQRQRTKCMAIVIGSFNTLIFLTGLAITVLNGVAISGGTRVKFNAGSSGDGSPRNYFSGLWYGCAVSSGSFLFNPLPP